MSGVAAVFDRCGNGLGRDLLDRVSFALAPYGRRRRDVTLQGEVGFVHTGFANSQETLFDPQPILGADGNLHLLFDGRLDNRPEVIHTLGLPARDADQATDSRLALLSWERWGSQAPLHWVGEFAVIVWDARTATLSALIDPLGQRQLVYATNPDLAVVASSAKAIFATGIAEPSLDMQALADHLGRLLPEPGRSFYRDIRRVPASHELTISRGRMDVARYYRLAPGEPIRLGSDEEYVEAASELLERVVKSHTRSAGTVGTDLSGGLDSTLVAAQSARVIPGTSAVPAFTVQAAADDTVDGVRGMVHDEGDRIRDMLAHVPRLQSVLIETRSDAAWDRFAELNFDLAEMPAGSAHFEETYVRKMETARDLGVTTLLTGHPGNLTLTWEGSGLFGEYLRSLRWIALARELGLAKGDWRSLPRRAYDFVLRPLLPRAIPRLASRVRDRALFEPPWRRVSVIKHDFAAEYNLAERARASLMPYDGGPGMLTAADRADVLTKMSHSHGAAGLQTARAAFEIEIRSPLWDQRIIEWSLRVPETQFRRDGIDRWLARRVGARLLPPSVAWNTKRGFLDAGWHSRIAADLPKLREQVRTIAEDAETAAMIDTARIDAILANWDDYRPDRIAPHQRYLLVAGLQSAIHAGRFVRWVRGANS